MEALLAASQEAARREAIKEGIRSFLGATDGEMVRKVVGAPNANPAPGDGEFARMMQGLEIHLDERESRHMHEEGGGFSGAMRYSHDFEPELAHQKEAMEAGAFSDEIWSAWGRGQARHVMHMSPEAMNLFIIRYGFHPADDLQEVKRIAINDPWVREFFTNPL